MDRLSILRAEMGLHGLSTRVLAGRIGVHESQISRQLTGIRPLPPERAKELVLAIHRDLLAVSGTDESRQGLPAA